MKLRDQVGLFALAVLVVVSVPTCMALSAAISRLPVKWRARFHPILRGRARGKEREDLVESLHGR